MSGPTSFDAIGFAKAHIATHRAGEGCTPLCDLSAAILRLSGQPVSGNEVGFDVTGVRAAVAESRNHSNIVAAVVMRLTVLSACDEIERLRAAIARFVAANAHVQEVGS